ncbi:hypothetical protein C8J57DRAFT_294593 [Mycena rebaudengoi]|nr:hypothetical protein C8J57DRAFT_294593 [Mycena rebaudengoi]
MAAAVRHTLYLVQEMETIGVAGLDAAVDEAIVLLLDGSTAGFITSNASPPDLDSIAAHLGIIVALSRSPRCSHALANRHSPRIVVKVLTLLSDLSPSHSDLDAAVACATLCVEHLCIILENTSGFGAILEAVDTLLLPVLIKCYVHFPHLNNLPPTKSDAAFLLSHVLSKYLVYISIHDPVSKSLDVIAENGYVTRLAPQTSFTRAWLDFSSLLSERMQVPARYFRQENQVVCNNITCRKMNAKAGLSCCRHCLRAFYCSKSCQKNDWKFGGHKEVCNRRLPAPPIKSFPVGNRDLHFFDEVLRRDLKTKFQEIRAAWDTSSVPVIIFDYTVHPFTMHATTTDFQDPRFFIDERQTQFWNETVAMVNEARRCGLNQGIVAAHLPCPGRPHNVTAMVTLAELERDMNSTGSLFGASTISVSE